MQTETNDKETQLKNILKSICNNPNNRRFGFWRFKYSDPYQYLKDINNNKTELINAVPENYKTKCPQGAPGFISEYSLKDGYDDFIKEYYDNIIFDALFLDFDDKENPREAISEALRLAQKLEHDYNIISLVNYSGSKGAQINLLFDPLEVDNEKAIKKSVCEYLIKTYKLKYLDAAVYGGGAKRLKRLPFTKHNLTGHYAHFFNYQDERTINNIFDMGLIEYDPLTLIKNDSAYYIPTPPDRKANTRGIKHIIKEAEIYKETEPAASKAGTPINEVYEVNTNNKSFDILTNHILKIYKEGKRNYIIVPLIHTLRRANMARPLVGGLLIGIDKQDPAHATGGSCQNNLMDWLNYAYHIDPQDPDEPRHLFGKKTLIERVTELSEGLDDAKEIIQFFKNFFNKTIKLKEPFNYLGKSYPVRWVGQNTHYYLINNFPKHGYNFKIDLNNKKVLLIEPEGSSQTIAAILTLNNKTKDLIKYTKQDMQLFNKTFKKLCDTDAADILEQFNLYLSNNSECQDLQSKEREALATQNIINQLKANPESKGALMRFSEILEDSAILKVCYNSNTKQKEYYTYNGEYYEKAHAPLIQKFIFDNFNLRLTPSSIKNLINSIPINANYNNEWWQMKDNIFFNGVTGEICEKPEGFLTNKKIGMMCEGKYKLIPYMTPEELQEDTEANGWSQYENIIYTIMSVPESKNQTINRFKGFQEVTGYIFRPINKNKKILNFTGPGDDGKTTLSHILTQAVGRENAAVIKAKELKKDFNAPNIGNKHIIIIDEAKSAEILPYESDIKTMSAGQSDSQERIIYSSEAIENINYGLICINSNKIIEFNASDEALMERDDVITMYRRFKETPDYEKGQLKTRDIDPILNNDFRGFARFINSSIHQYNKTRNKKRFALSTTINQTKALILKSDIIKQFLAVKTRYSDRITYTTNGELTSAFIKYCEANNINIKDHINFKNEKTLNETIKIKMGAAVKEFYKDYDQEDLITQTPGDRHKAYYIRLLDNSEVEERAAEVYHIEDENQTALRHAAHLEGIERLVYNLIKRLDVANLNNMLKESDIKETELIKTLQRLENDYIIYKD